MEIPTVQRAWGYPHGKAPPFHPATAGAMGLPADRAPGNPQFFPYFRHSKLARIGDIPHSDTSKIVGYEWGITLGIPMVIFFHSWEMMALHTKDRNQWRRHF